MKYKKEQLVKLIQFVTEISNMKGNEWFRKRIIEELAENDKQKSNTYSNNVSSLIDDIKRTKLFLKNIDRSNYLEGFNFYKNIQNAELKGRLIADYKEMKIALLHKDIFEYARRISIQLERCFDFIIEKTNGWEVVMNSPNSYTEITVPSGSFNQTFRIKDNFYKNDMKNSGQKIPKDISEIEFKSKGVYCFIYYQFDFINYFSSFNDIYFLRNKASHGSISPKDAKRIEKILSKFPEQKVYYNKMFETYLKSLNDLYI